jgi:hypothetical protein
VSIDWSRFFVCNQITTLLWWSSLMNFWW